MRGDRRLGLGQAGRTQVIVAILSGIASIGVAAVGAFAMTSDNSAPPTPPSPPASPAASASETPTLKASIPAMSQSQGSTAIWTAYEFPDFKGRSWTFYGDAKCEQKQYAFDTSAIGWGIRSWKAHSHCWHTTIYYSNQPASPSYTYPAGWWHVSRIYHGMDAHVWSVWTRYGPD